MRNRALRGQAALGPSVILAQGLLILCMMSPAHSCLVQSGRCRSYWKLPFLPGKVNEVPATLELRILKRQPSVLIVIIHDNYDDYSWLCDLCSPVKFSSGPQPTQFSVLVAGAQVAGAQAAQLSDTP